jgi:hypothetical protein
MASRSPRLRRWSRTAEWVAAIAVPIALGGLVGGSLGGLVTAIVLVPWVSNLLGRRTPTPPTRSTAAREHRPAPAACRPEPAGEVEPPIAA